MRTVKTSIFFFLFIALFSLTTPAATQTPRVVTSIPPLQFIAQAITFGISKPKSLITSQGSEHQYSLRPSDAQMLSDADIILYTSHELETFLTKPLEAHKNHATLIEAVQVQNMMLLPARQHHSHNDEHHDKDSHADEQEEEAMPTDPHVWLYPANAIAIATELTRVLSEKDPKNSEQYLANLEYFIKSLSMMSSDITQQIAPYKDQSYILYHDAYQYFEKAFNIAPKGVMTLNPHQGLSAGRLHDILEESVRTNARCLFTEPQFDGDAVESLAKDLDLQTAVIDPLGSDIEPSRDAYVDLQYSIADTITGCLTRQH